MNNHIVVNNCSRKELMLMLNPDEEEISNYRYINGTQDSHVFVK